MPNVKRIMITGSNGLLGQKLVEILVHCNTYDLLLTSKQPKCVFDDVKLRYVQLDTTQRQDVRRIVDEFEPEVIINAAALTDVDRCETERENAWRVNVGTVENLIYAARLVGARIIHVSTDYIFDGQHGPYAEGDRPSPLGYYGRTKLAGENLLKTSGVPHAVVRTMVLYGIGFGVKTNFALWLLKSLNEEEAIRVVDDQIGSPTLADDVAYGILKIIELGRTGVYHIAGPDLMSRYDFALAFAETFGFKKKLITPVKTATLKQKAPRPLKSGLIILKAETDLGIKTYSVAQGLIIFKNQLNVYLQAAVDVKA